MKDKKRTMIISWKWEDFKSQQVTTDLLEEKAIPAIIENPQQRYYDVYPTYLRRTNEETMVEPAATIVRTYAKNGEKVIDFLLALIEQYTQSDSEVFVFLHRRDGFTNKEVATILKNTNAEKCFLIGGGKDFIYYPTAKQGLLGDNGAFFYNEPSINLPEIIIADDAQKRVYQPHFDKVWYYYNTEFDTKFFELKEDLLSHFYPSFANETTYSRTIYYDHLAKNELLFLRVKSFIDEQYLSLSPLEKEQLQQWEKVKGRSFTFDDCQENLVRLSDKEIKEYTEINTLLYQLFFDEKEDYGNSTSSLQHLQKIQNKFQNLIEIF